MPNQLAFKGAIYYVTITMVISSRVKIWSFRGKARLVFYWCLYYNIQLFPEGEVNSGGYIPRREASRYISTALHRPQMDKKCCFINGYNFFFWNFRETTHHFPLPSQNSEYLWIFRVTGANQNVRKLLSTDLVNTNRIFARYLKILMLIIITGKNIII